MKKIIVPVDFSATAENAALYAANIANFYGAEIWLFYNYGYNVTLAEYGYAAVTDAEMESAACFELEAFSKKIQAQLKLPVRMHTKATGGDLMKSLNDFCAETEADLVVFGLSGKNALTRLVVGSNTIRAIQQLKYPVLVVPPKAEFMPVRKIGFACDYNKVVQATPLEFLKKTVKDFNADLYVLNVEYIEGQSGEAAAKSLAISGLLQDCKPYYSAIYSPDVTMGINWFAEKEKIDWMYMIPRQHNLMDKIFGRSQTKELLYHTKVPVLCMHE